MELIEFIQAVFLSMHHATLGATGWGLVWCIAFWLSCLLVIGWAIISLFVGFFTSGLWKICIYLVLGAVVGGIIYLIIIAFHFITRFLS